MESRIYRRRKSVLLRGRVRGMSLIEVLVSMTIFAVGVLGLFSSHATAFNSYSDAKFRVDASLLADRLIGEMWVDRANAADYAYGGHNSVTPIRLAAWLAQLQQTLPAADAVVQINGNAGTGDGHLAATRR